MVNVIAGLKNDVFLFCFVLQYVQCCTNEKKNLCFVPYKVNHLVEYTYIKLHIIHIYTYIIFF